MDIQSYSSVPGRCEQADAPERLHGGVMESSFDWVYNLVIRTLSGEPSPGDPERVAFHFTQDDRMSDSFSSVPITEPPSQRLQKPDQSPKSQFRRSIAWICFAAGLLIFVCGCYLEARNPRTNVEDNIAWLVLGIGVSLGSFGIAFRFLHPALATITAFVSPFLAFAFAVVMFWSFLIITAYGNRHHQEFAANGVSQIAPARQMAELFADCRHYVTGGPNNTVLFNSVAYFGDRYELTMQAPVKIESKTSGSMIGEPQFYLNEVSTVRVSPSGQVGASFSRNKNFGTSEWEKVYHANGNFGTIGFDVNPTPVVDFHKYTDAARPSN